MATKPLRNRKRPKTFQLLSSLSVKEIDHRTIRSKIDYSFKECEEYILSFFPNALPDKLGMFKTQYKVNGTIVGYVSMYSGIQYIARIGNDIDLD
jgi:hypothetical protein